MIDELRWAVDGPPIGVWTTVQGTAEVLMQDTLCLLSDGPGYLQRRSVWAAWNGFLSCGSMSKLEPF
jgi:hypothetical protein